MEEDVYIYTGKRTVARRVHSRLVRNLRAEPSLWEGYRRSLRLCLLPVASRGRVTFSRALLEEGLPEHRVGCESFDVLAHLVGLPSSIAGRVQREDACEVRDVPRV